MNQNGAIIEWSYGTGLYVLDGGTYISGGTPLRPSFNIEDIGEFYFGFWVGMYITETASKSCELNYLFVESAQVGILIVNNELDKPVENNIVMFSNYGIGEFGPHHTDVINNTASCNFESGIEIYFSGMSGQEDANSIVRIQNNTTHFYQFNGIAVHGVEHEPNSGLLILENNIASASFWYNINLVGGYMSLCTKQRLLFILAISGCLEQKLGF